MNATQEQKYQPGKRFSDLNVFGLISESFCRRALLRRKSFLGKGLVADEAGASYYKTFWICQYSTSIESQWNFAIMLGY